MEQLGLIADAWLSRHPEIDLDCRFDIIGINLTNNGHKIKHIEDAFRL
jgi:Holliday junction resolvase-like predicted endonuclease